MCVCVCVCVCVCASRAPEKALALSLREEEIVITHSGVNLFAGSSFCRPSTAVGKYVSCGMGASGDDGILSGLRFVVRVRGVAR